ncbi:hypothetical protein B0H12DRAFT_1067443 [Mycena haematopus]|nr:hypothetical protein B0H12DRAFT_1067443 [Mycena haematopus]
MTDNFLHFCLPLYHPDPGHEDKAAHDASPRAFYYGIASQEGWGGVVSSSDALSRQLKKYPDARTFSASTWRGIMDLWNKDCERYHSHTAKELSDTELRSSASTARVPAERPRSISPTKGRSHGTTSPTKFGLRRKDTPATPGSSALPPFPNPVRDRAGYNTADVAAQFESWAKERDSEQDEQPLLYGVSGHNRVFQDWDRAMKVLRDTPGADMVFAYDEASIREFVRGEAARMLKKYTPTTAPLSQALYVAVAVMANPTPTLSTHASRHPSKPTQPPRKRATDAGRGTLDIRDASQKEKREQMMLDIEVFHDYRLEKVTELANKYQKDESFFLKMLSNQSQYSATRGMTLYNAIRHDLSVKAKDVGDSKNALDLNDELADGEYERIKDGLSKEEENRLFAQLRAHRELKRRGIRATNRSAATDALQNATRIGDVMRNLFERTGVRALAMFTRGNPDDPAAPHFVDSDQARLFFQQVMKIDMYDVLLKFEQWSCTRDSGVKERNDLDTVRKEIAEMILEGLCKIKNNKKVAMDYVNYRLGIVYELGVELAGWPTWVDMVRPSKLSAENARDVWHKLRSGAIHWVTITKSQRDELGKELEQLRAQGPLKPRKERTDKGKKRGARTKKNPQHSETDDDEDEPDANARGRAPNKSGGAGSAGGTRGAPLSKNTAVPTAVQPAAGAATTDPAAGTTTPDPAVQPAAVQPAAVVPTAIQPTAGATAADPAASATTPDPAVQPSAGATTPNAGATNSALAPPTTEAAVPTHVGPPIAIYSAVQTAAADAVPTPMQDVATAVPSANALDSVTRSVIDMESTTAAHAVPTSMQDVAMSIVPTALPSDMANSLLNVGLPLPPDDFSSLIGSDPSLFDYSRMDFSNVLFPPVFEDPTPFPDVRLNVSNLDMGTRSDDSPPAPSSSSFNVFSVSTNVGDAMRKRPHPEDESAAPAAKKARKPRADKGVPRGPRTGTTTASSGAASAGGADAAKTRKKRKDAGVPRVRN